MSTCKCCVPDQPCPCVQGVRFLCTLPLGKCLLPSRPLHLLSFSKGAYRHSRLLSRVSILVPSFLLSLLRPVLYRTLTILSDLLTFIFGLCGRVRTSFYLPHVQDSGFTAKDFVKLSILLAATTNALFLSLRFHETTTTALARPLSHSFFCVDRIILGKNEKTSRNTVVSSLGGLW